MKRLASISLALLFLLACQSAPGANGRGTVKVFILAGQSNMEGKAAASTLKAAVDDNPNDPRFKHLMTDGKWNTRDDVFVTFLCRSDKRATELAKTHGPLTIGFGSQKNARNDNGQRIAVPGIGPELGIGHVLGEHFNEPVLLVKAAWGGRSVKYNFRSPSGMPSDEELQRQFEQIKAKRPDANYEEWKSGFGQNYRDMIAEVHKVTSEIEKYVPGYDKNQGFEIAGLIWFQGWNDGVGSGNPDYTEQLAAMIRDIRKEFDSPDMPVVIGELGTDGAEAGGWVATFRAQQAAVAELPEFKDNVRFARTAHLWPNPPDLSAEWEDFRTQAKKNEAKPKDDPTRIDPGEFYIKNWEIKYREQRKYTSDKRYHYLGSGKCYYLMGESMAESMVELLK